MDDVVEIVTDLDAKIAKQIAENACGNHNAFAFVGRQKSLNIGRCEA